MEHFLRRCRWRAIAYQIHIKIQNNPIENDDSDDIELFEFFESYGFKSELKPPVVPELVPFEKACWELVKNLKYKEVFFNKFQHELTSDLNKIKNEK